MIERLDYSKYLSVDNGKGLLLKRSDCFVLEQYGIDYYKYSMGDLILVIGNYIDDHYDDDIEDLEEVLSNLVETHYYTEVKK